MRDIYETAKQSQMAPVRGRVKAMMAQPRAVAQARKTARQTTGFAKGGVPSMIYGTSRPGVFKAPRGREGMKRRLSLEEKLRMQKKGTIDKKTGRLHPAHEAALKSLSSKQINQMIKKGYNPKLGKPTRGALTTKQDIKKSLKESKQEAKYFKEMKAKGIKKIGGVIQKQAGGKISTPMTHDSDFTRWFESQYGGTEKGKPHSTLEGRAAAGRRYMRRAEKYWTKKREEEKKRKDDPHHPKDKLRAGPQAPAQPSPKAGPPAGRPKEYQDPFKKQKEEEGMYVKKGGHMEKGKPHSTKIGKVSSMYRRVLRSRDKDRLSGRDIERASGKEYATASEIHALHEMLKKETPRGKGKEKGKEHRKKLLDLMRKASGYAEGFVTGKKKGGKVDKKWIQKAVNPKHKGYCTPMTKKTCTPARKRLAKLFKSKAKKGWSKGGLPYLTRGWSRPGVYKAPRGKHHMAELLAGKTSKLKMPKKTSGKKLAAVAGVGAIGAETYRQKTKKKKKSVEESLIEKIKKKANGGTIVMPTVGNKIGTRAYKHGAVIHPRPRPTTMAHGRERGVGIAKRGW